MSNKHRDQFERRFGAFQIPKGEIDRMYQREMEYQLHLQWMSEQALADRQGGAAYSPAGGGNRESISSACLEMVVNTEDESTFGFRVYTSASVNLTIDWGDGNVQVENLVPDINNDSFEINHPYSQGQDFNVQVCFDNPTVITRLTFEGLDYDYSVLKTITGLQAFINLSRFDADDNALQSVDLSGLSNLIELHLDHNALQSVDLSGLSNLTFLGLDDNALQSVDLSGLSNLTRVDLDDNALQSVDLSNLSNLIRADIGDNFIVGTSTPSLTSVNLSGCVALKELRLDDSDFSAGIPDLSGLNSLEFIDMDESLISGSVDISFLPALDDFDFSLNSGLTELIISSSQPLGFDNRTLNASGCGLTQTSVDAILVALSLNGISPARIFLNGGTNASPGATGLAAIDILEGNGWTVLVNE